jgi:hypothetical protein
MSIETNFEDNLQTLFSHSNRFIIMKNLSSLCVFWALVITLASCNKDEASPAPLSGSVNFKFDSTKIFQSTFSSGVWEPNNALLSIVAKAGKSLLVMNTLMPNGLKAGTYSFTANAPFAMVTFFREDSTKVTEGYYSNIDGGSYGVLVITNVTADSLVTGTFKFMLKDPVTSKIKVLDQGVITDLKVVNNKSITTGGTNTFSAKIDGVLWPGKQILGSNYFGKITITNSDGTKSMGFQLVETIKPGTYNMDFGSDYHVQYSPTLSLTNPESYVASTATSKLTITEHNTTTRQIKGTFNFKGTLFPNAGTKSYLITEGAFSVKY